MRLKSLWGLLLWTFLAGCFLAMSANGQITVTGTNTYPADHQNLQVVLNGALQGSTVLLQGAFDFGTDGGVRIQTSDITLLGDGATITGGGMLHPTFTFPGQGGELPLRFAIAVEAVGVKVKNITLSKPGAYSGIFAGIAIGTGTTNPEDNPVVVEENAVTFPISGVWARWTGCPIRVLKNTIVSPRAVWIYQNSGDVLVSDNILTATVYGTYIMLNTRDCIVTGNTLYAGSTCGGFHVCTTPGYGSILIDGNTSYGSNIGIAVHDLGALSHDLPAVISNNRIESEFTTPANTTAIGILGQLNYCPLQILNNTVRVLADQPGATPVCHQFGVWLCGWYLGAPGGRDQDNPPVLVKGNTVDIRYPLPAQPDWTKLLATGMVLGYPIYGLNNVTVESNVFSGGMVRGIFLPPYAKNILIAGNDFSGLKTWSAQLALYAGKSVVKDNVLGFANTIPGYSVAVELASVRPSASVPMPYPVEQCVITNNDFRLTELPGWSEQGSGCILLYSAVDYGGLGTEVMNNLIFESGGFPAGTGGARNQVYELKTSSGLVHDNRILGLPANFVWTKGIGQRLKAIGGRFSESMDGSLLIQAQECGIGNAPLGRLEAPPPAMPAATRPPAPPASPELCGNYPNPFNPSTSIRYGLPEAMPVRLEVYNTLGQLVAKLVNGEEPAGYHEVRFDASNLASGMYVYRLQAGNVVQSRKLMLVR